MGFQGEKHASCAEPPHLLVTVTVHQPLVPRCHHDGAIPTMRVSEISRFPAWQGLQRPREVEEELYNSSKTVQGTEEGNTSEEKKYSSLVLAHNLVRKRRPIRCIYMDKHRQICSACTPSWRGTSQLQSRWHELCAVLPSILPKRSIAKKLWPLHLSI